MKDIDITKPYQVLSSDITYIRTAQGFEYLCQIIDVHTKQVLGSAQASHMKSELVVEAIERAVGRFRIGAGIIFHSDRGSQYTSKLITKTLAHLGWIASYSRVGKPVTTLGVRASLHSSRKKLSTAPTFKPEKKPVSVSLSIFTGSTTPEESRNYSAIKVPRIS